PPTPPPLPAPLPPSRATPRGGRRVTPIRNASPRAPAPRGGGSPMRKVSSRSFPVLMRSSVPAPGGSTAPCRLPARASTLTRRSAGEAEADEGGVEVVGGGRVAGGMAEREGVGGEIGAVGRVAGGRVAGSENQLRQRRV